MVREERVKLLNRRRLARGSYVLYWMQASQRAACNHALTYAVERADELGQPLLAFFGIAPSYLGAGAAHYRFMLEGLRETEAALAERGIRLVARRVSPEKGVLDLAHRASLVVVDRGYLRLQRRWRVYAARRIECPLIQVESDAVVPVEAAYPREAYSAAVLRPRIRDLLERFLVLPPEAQPRKGSLGLDVEGLSLSDPESVLREMRLRADAKAAPRAAGGASRALARLDSFIENDLDRYAEEANDPSRDRTSRLSPYLHFGQISPLYVALRVMEAGGPGAEAYLEELIVRRELSLNYVFYNPRYDSLLGLPAWALATLREHAGDRREHLYTARDLEAGRTHDPYWNAAQLEMTATGRMHNYMRMYWGKKIIEWSESPEEAFRLAVRLNDKYELDGRDPNGYAGVAWCFGKHDRPWKERPVLGKLRYMSAAGLERKFDMAAYVRRVEALKEAAQAPQAASRRRHLGADKDMSAQGGAAT